jgi:hypothetical protein
MSELTCPACSQTREPAARIGSLAVCASCGVSVVIEPDLVTVRRATAQDTSALNPSDLETLRRARAKIVRGERQR